MLGVVVTDCDSHPVIELLVDTCGLNEFNGETEINGETEANGDTETNGVIDSRGLVDPIIEDVPIEDIEGRGVAVSPELTDTIGVRV